MVKDYSVSFRVPRAGEYMLWRLFICLKAMTFTSEMPYPPVSLGCASFAHQKFPNVNPLSVSPSRTFDKLHILAACRAIDITPTSTHPKFSSS